MNALRLAAYAAIATAGCRGCNDSAIERAPAPRSAAHDEDDDEQEEREERDQSRPNFWRVQIAIVGQGTVKTTRDTFDCRSDGKRQAGECGPKLIAFPELEPPLLHATGASGWRLDHWASTIRQPNGSTRPRAGAMPDGRLYVDGFGYTDTGELETVTAVFVAVPADQDDLTADRAAAPNR